MVFPWRGGKKKKKKKRKEKKKEDRGTKCFNITASKGISTWHELMGLAITAD